MQKNLAVAYLRTILVDIFFHSWLFSPPHFLNCPWRMPRCPMHFRHPGRSRRRASQRVIPTDKSLTALPRLHRHLSAIAPAAAVSPAGHAVIAIRPNGTYRGFRLLRPPLPTVRPFPCFFRICSALLWLWPQLFLPPSPNMPWRRFFPIGMLPGPRLRGGSAGSSLQCCDLPAVGRYRACQLCWLPAVSNLAHCCWSSFSYLQRNYESYFRSLELWTKRSRKEKSLFKVFSSCYWRNTILNS